MNEFFLPHEKYNIRKTSGFVTVMHEIIRFEIVAGVSAFYGDRSHFGMVPDMEKGLKLRPSGLAVSIGIEPMTSWLTARRSTTELQDKCISI